jgi:hypothetical protein
MVLFDSPTEWIGKPVQTGERVMRIARPDEVEIEAWIPVGDAIPLEADAPVRLYLAANPWRAWKASSDIRPMTPVPGRMAAMPTGCAPQCSPDSRRVSASKARPSCRAAGYLAYWILRKPLAVVRQFIAW